MAFDPMIFTDYAPPALSGPNLQALQRHVADYVEQRAALLPSGGDDTARINAAIAIGQPLGVGTFPISDLITGLPLGVSTEKTIIQATNSNARMAFGGAVGTAPVQGNGTFGNFFFDGKYLAGASNPLILCNCSGALFLPIGCTGGLGDGVLWAGQNSVFVNLNTGGHNGCSLAIDNGAGDAQFLKPELSYTGAYHVEIRNSVPGSPQGYGVPMYNYFEDGICEGLTWGSQPHGKACVHMLAGRWNRFKDMNFFVDSWPGSPVHTSMVLIEATTSQNGDHEFRDCVWTGPGTGYGIEAYAVSGGVAGPFNSVYRPYELSGNSVFAALDYAELIGTISPPRRRGTVSYA